MEYTNLGRTGLRVSRLGLGGAPLAGSFGATDSEEMQQMIHQALDIGINFIDTAPYYGYGESERRIGNALKDGRRADVIIASKCIVPEILYTYDKVIASVEESLRLLQTDWVDILQIHEADSQPRELLLNETIPALLKLKEAGKIRFIGISGKITAVLCELLKLGVFDTVQAYCRYMLIDHTAKDELLPLVHDRGIGFINGSVLGMGILADKPALFLDKELVEQADARLKQIAFIRKAGAGGFIEPAMRFSLSHPDVHVTLTGADRTEILHMNAAFCDGVGLNELEQKRVYGQFQDQILFPN